MTASSPPTECGENFPDLWSDFQEWLERNGERVALQDYNSQKFHAEMDEHFPRSDKRVRGYYRRNGLKLVEGGLVKLAQSSG